jgi:putative DNA-invertase from lambdoid prophage Rac
MNEWTKEENDLVLANLEKTYKEIKVILNENGFDRPLLQISRKLGKFRKNENHVPHSAKKILEDNIDFIVEKLTNGVSFSKISKSLGVNSITFVKFIQNNPTFKIKVGTKYYSKQELNIVQAEADKPRESIKKILLSHGFERSIDDISQMRLKLALPKRSRSPSTDVIKNNTENIIKMLEEGKSIKFIAYEFGINKTYLRTYLKDTMKLDLSKYCGVIEYRIAKQNEIEKESQKQKEQELLPPIIYAYIRVSTEGQTVENQRHELIPFAKSKGYVIEEWFEETISGAKEIHKREINNLLQKVKKGDIIFVAELSRLSRRLVDILSILEKFTKKGVALYSKKENFELNNSILSTIMASIFGIFAQLERDLTAQRTKEGIDRRKSMGMKMGRSQKLKSAMDIRSSACVEHKEKIQELLEQKISIKEIAKIINVNNHTLMCYLEHKRKGLHVVSPEERKQAIDKKRQEIGKGNLLEYLPDFVSGDLNYLKNNKDKFIAFKNLGFSYDNLSIILQIDKASLQSLMK